MHTEHTNSKLTITSLFFFLTTPVNLASPKTIDAWFLLKWTSKLHSEFAAGGKSAGPSPSYRLLALPGGRGSLSPLRECGPRTETSSHGTGREAKSNLDVEKPGGLDSARCPGQHQRACGQCGPSRGWAKWHFCHRPPQTHNPGVITRKTPDKFQQGHPTLYLTGSPPTGIQTKASRRGQPKETGRPCTVASWRGPERKGASGEGWAGQGGPSTVTLPWGVGRGKLGEGRQLGAFLTCSSYRTLA